MSIGWLRETGVGWHEFDPNAECGLTQRLPTYQQRVLIDFYSTSISN